MKIKDPWVAFAINAGIFVSRAVLLRDRMSVRTPSDLPTANKQPAAKRDERVHLDGAIK